jgi:hypothetical protein
MNRLLAFLVFILISSFGKAHATSKLPEIYKLGLYNTKTDTYIRDLNYPEDVISLAELGDNVTIRAFAKNTESVRFNYNGKSNFMVQNVDPYTLYRNHKNDYFRAEYNMGLNTLNVTPFEKDHATGVCGVERKYKFYVLGDFRLEHNQSPCISVSTAAKNKYYEFTATVLDDYINTDSAQVKWTKRSGPGNVHINKVGNLKAKAYFSKEGIYELVAEVSDGIHNSGSVFTVNVNNVSPAPPSSVFKKVYIYDTKNNKIVTELTDNAIVDISKIKNHFTIVADTENRVQSVKFELVGQQFVKIENHVPYVLTGNDGNNYRPWTNFTEKKYLLKMIAFDRDQTSTKNQGYIEPKVINFTLVNNPK